MSKSLRDQLVEAGLAKAKDAKKIEKQQQNRANASRKSKAGEGQAGGEQGSKGNTGGKGKGKANAKPVRGASAAQIKARAAREKKAQRDKELAEERNAQAAAKAKRAEIKQLVTDHDQRESKKSDDDVPYNFKHGKKIKRIHVPPAQLDLLSRGALVIVNNDGRYHLVTKDIAAKIAERDPKWIVAAHDAEKPEEEMDDFYKKFEVPDDLDW